MKKQLRNYQAIFGIFDKWNITLIFYFIVVVGGLILHICFPQSGGISTFAIVMESVMFSIVPLTIATSFNAKQAFISTLPLTDKEITDVTVRIPQTAIFPALVVTLIICVIMNNGYLALLQLSKLLLTLAAIYFSLAVIFKYDLKKTSVGPKISYFIVYLAIYSYGFFIFVILEEFTYNKKMLIILVTLNIILAVMVIVARFFARKSIANQLKLG